MNNKDVQNLFYPLSLFEGIYDQWTIIWFSNEKMARKWLQMETDIESIRTWIFSKSFHVYDDDSVVFGDDDDNN